MQLEFRVPCTESGTQCVMTHFSNIAQIMLSPFCTILMPCCLSRRLHCLPAQAIYEAVLAAHTAVIAGMRPGVAWPVGRPGGADMHVLVIPYALYLSRYCAPCNNSQFHFSESSN